MNQPDARGMDGVSGSGIPVARVEAFVALHECVSGEVDPIDGCQAAFQGEQKPRADPLALPGWINHEAANRAHTVLDDAANTANDDARAFRHKRQVFLDVSSDGGGRFGQRRYVPRSTPATFLFERELLQAMHADRVTNLSASNRNHVCSVTSNVRANHERGGRCWKAG